MLFRRSLLCVILGNFIPNIAAIVISYANDDRAHKVGELMGQLVGTVFVNSVNNAKNGGTPANYMPTNNANYDPYYTYPPETAGQSYGQPYYTQGANDQYAPADNNGYQTNPAGDPYDYNYDYNTDANVYPNNNVITAGPNTRYQSNGGYTGLDMRQGGIPSQQDEAPKKFSDEGDINDYNTNHSIKVKKFVFQAQPVRPENEKTPVTVTLYYLI